MRDAKFFARLHKCSFIQEKVEYLDFGVSRDGVQLSPENGQDSRRVAAAAVSERYTQLLGPGRMLQKIHSAISV